MTLNPHSHFVIFPYNNKILKTNIFKSMVSFCLDEDVSFAIAIPFKWLSRTETRAFSFGMRRNGDENEARQINQLSLGHLKIGAYFG